MLHQSWSTGYLQRQTGYSYASINTTKRGLQELFRLLAIQFQIIAYLVYISSELDTFKSF